MLKKLFKTGVTAAAGWVGNAIGGETGRNIAGSITDSLFSRQGQGSGGNFELANTSVAAQSYEGRVGFERSNSAGKNSNIRTADGNQLRDEWDNRLTRWYRNKDQMFT